MPVFVRRRKHLKTSLEITSYQSTEEAFMPATNSRFFDELAKLMTNAAGAAQGVRKEVDTLVQSQVERVLNNMSIVRREDFDVVKDMAEKARSENMKLEARIAELEKKLSPQ
jgi:BMFP domain-containing protein YqiC